MFNGFLDALKFCQKIKIAVELLNSKNTVDLQQQVMSPAVLGGNAIPTVLVGATNFGAWLKRVEKFISTTNMEWREYLLTGDFAESRAGINLTNNEISYVNGVLDQAISMVIINSVSDDIKKIVQKYYDNDENATSRDVLVYLKERYSDMKVRGYAEFVGQYKSMQGKNVKEQSEWAQQCATDMLKFAEPKGNDNVSCPPEDKLAALLMLTFHPDKIKPLMGFIGKRESVGPKEVVDLLRDVMPPANDIVMTAHKKTKRKSNKKGCYFCGGEHSLHRCQKMKDLHPDASIFNNEKKNDPSKQKDPLFGVCATVDGGIGRNKWIFDSGSSIHVCNDRSQFFQFTTAVNDEISGLVGKVAVEGYGTVAMGGLKLHNVAYVPGAPFNLIALLADIYSDSVDDKHIVDFIFLELHVTVPPASCVTVL